MEPASDVQDKHGSTNLNTVHDPNNQLCVEIRSSANALQQNEMGSSGDEHAFKVRKPYTITKQRERWTEEEHNKFLEAVKLYGRAWRRIEEHIGTKTAVQIRSHAQKFFTKVGRDSAGNNSGTITPIEIPPPRPKRKPMHPYPRKLSSLSSKGGLITQQQDRSSSPQSVSGQENGSPTSVLSGIGPSFLNFPSNCTSPISSAAGSSPVGMLMILKENEERSQNASAEDSLPLFEGLTNKEQDLTPEDDVSLKEDSSVATDLPTLKLFGQTVLVTDSQKPCFPTLENAVARCNTLPTANVESHSRNIDMDSKATGLAGQCAWSAWPSVPPLFYCLPSSGNLVGSTEAPFFPLPWWFYGGGLSVFSPPQNATCTKDAPQSCRGEDDKVEQIEGSWTGSNTASASEAGIADKSSGDVDSQSAASSLKSSENLASNCRKVYSDRPMRGFVPYKRCVAERETENLQMANEEGESRRLRLCL